MAWRWRRRLVCARVVIARGQLAGRAEARRVFSSGVDRPSGAVKSRLEADKEACGLNHGRPATETSLCHIALQSRLLLSSSRRRTTALSESKKKKSTSTSSLKHERTQRHKRELQQAIRLSSATSSTGPGTSADKLTVATSLTGLPFETRFSVSRRTERIVPSSRHG